MTSRRMAVRAAALLATFSLAGCGYALVGRGITTDPSIKRVGVPLFKNRTGKAELEQKITQRVIEELLKRKRFEVVTDTTGVDAVVDGEIVSYVARAAGFSNAGAAAAGTTEATQYRVTLTAKVRYLKVGQTEPIWSNDAFQHEENYDVGSDPSTFFDREGQAVDRLTTNFSRSLVSAMLEAF